MPISVQSLRFPFTEAKFCMLKKVLKLSCQIFGTEEGSNKYSDVTEWELRLEDKRSIIYYAYNDGDSEPVALLFAHPKIFCEFEGECLHIWLAGVSENFRKQYLFTALMDSVHQYARDLKMRLTVCTEPSKHQAMFAYLQKQGWHVFHHKSLGKICLCLDSR